MRVTLFSFTDGWYENPDQQDHVRALSVPGVPLTALQMKSTGNRDIHRKKKKASGVVKAKYNLH